jgi:fumarate hydratase subunit alpha
VRTITTAAVTDLVSRLYQEANFALPDDVIAVLEGALDAEESEAGRSVLNTLLENAVTAEREKVPLCQDTGIAVVFAAVGQEVHLEGGELGDAIDAGIRRAWKEGYLRASVVEDPVFKRANTGDNTPAVSHVDLVEGDAFEVTVLPKGAGSENMSRLAMLKPHDGAAGITRFAVDTVEQAGASACPPIFLGIGIGGTMDHAAMLSKKALLRTAGEPSPVDETARLEQEILKQVNRLGIGPAGFGGTVTCLGVSIEASPCHIASLPVAVTIQCNSARRATGTL